MESRSQTPSYPMSLHQVGDKFFKTMFSSSLALRDFLIDCFGEKSILDLQFDSLEVLPGQFITPFGKTMEADLLIQLSMKGIALPILFLIEHQSTPDITMPLRVWQYACEALRRHVKHQGFLSRQSAKTPFKLPQLIPIVFYTGERVYPYKNTLSSLMERSFSCDKVTLEVDFILMEARRMKRNLRGTSSCYPLGLRIFQRASQAKENELMALMKLLGKKYSTGDVSFVRMGIMILFSQNILFANEAFVKKVSAFFEQTIGGEIMKVAESWIALGEKRGIKAGISQGLSQGLNQGLSKAKALWLESNQAITVAMLKQGFSQEAIDAIVGLSQSKLDAMVEDLRS